MDRWKTGLNNSYTIHVPPINILHTIRLKVILNKFSQSFLQWGHADYLSLNNSFFLLLSSMTGNLEVAALQDPSY